jgi:hypothetical protein
MFATTDFGALPIVKVTFADHSPTDEEYLEYLDSQLINYKLGVMGLLVDAREARMPSRAHQKLKNEWLKLHKDEIQTYCVGYAFVMQGRMLSLLFNVILNIFSSIVPYKVFDKMEDGEAWLHKMLLKRLGSSYVPKKADWDQLELKPLADDDLIGAAFEPFAIVDTSLSPLVSIA